MSSALAEATAVLARLGSQAKATSSMLDAQAKRLAIKAGQVEKSLITFRKEVGTDGVRYDAARRRILINDRLSPGLRELLAKRTAKQATQADKDARIEEPTPSPHNEDMTDFVPRPELDAKLDAVHAKVDARLLSFEKTVGDAMGEIRGELKAIHVEIGHLKNVKSNIWSATAVIVTLTVGSIFAAAALGFGAFDSGRDTAVIIKDAEQRISKMLSDAETSRRQPPAPTATPAPPGPVPPEPK